MMIATSQHRKPTEKPGGLPQAYAALFAERGWLSRTPAEFRDAVLSVCETIRAEPGQEIHREGEPISGMYGVCHGAIELLTRVGPSGDHVIHLGQPGLWIGAAAVLKEGPLDRLSVAARGQVVLAHLSRESIDRLVANRPEWWRYIGAQVAENIEIALGAAADLLIRDIQRRSIAVLLRLCDCRHGGPVGEEALTTPISQEELAFMTHLSRNAVGGVVRELAARKLIRLRYRTIELLAPDVLRAMVDGPE